MIKEKLKKYRVFRVLSKMLHMKSGRNAALNTNGYDILKTVHQIMKDNQINYFVDFGTLLGLIREGRLLSFDVDLDFGVLGSDEAVKALVRSTFEKYGYTVKEFYEVNGDIKEETYKNGVSTFDIYYYEKYEKGYFCNIFCRIDGVKYPDDNSFSVGYYRYPMDIVPEERVIHDIPVMIPKNAEQLLEYKYGKNWRTPNKYWHYWYDADVEKSDLIAKWHNIT